MSDARFQRVKEVYLTLLATDGREREQALRRECRGDDALAAEVRSLLHSEPGGLLAEPALGAAFSVAKAMAHAEGLVIGPYRTEAVLGAGTFGIVYRARDAHDGRDVALKVLRPGRATPAAIARFDREAVTLRRLDHPGIARVFDAGRTELHGETTPWLAMELIAGEPLDQHHRRGGGELRPLLVRLAAIADAVQHAHDHGVVHNDLKPDNVLVTATGEIKVVDFGLAALVGDSQVPDADADGGGTPAYISPERRQQRGVAGLPGDVWALGAIAYELLSGRPPLDWRSTLPRRLQADDEPWPLGSLRPELRGDLATIVHYALAGEPKRRCPSAGFFAAELRRFLGGQPIRSPRPRLLHRLQRFASQHRAAAIGSVSTLLALVLGIAATTTAWANADEARAAEQVSRELAEVRLADATAARERAERVSTFLTDLLRAPMADGDGARPDLESVFVAAAQKLEQVLPSDSALQAGMCQALGVSLFGFGRFDQATAQLQRALQLLRIEKPADAQAASLLQLDLGVTQLQAGHPAAALHTLTLAAAALRALPSPPPRQLLRCAFNQALAALDAGEQRLAQQLVDEAAPLLADTAPGDHLALLVRSLSGRLAGQRGEHATAAAIFEECLALAVEHLGEGHPQTLTLQNNLALECLDLDQVDRGEALMLAALAGRQKRFGDDHPETLQSLHNLASLRSRQQRLPEAIALHEQVIAGRTRRLGADHPKTLATRNNLARLFEQTGDAPTAEAMLRAVLSAAETKLPKGHWQTTVARRNLGALLQDQQRDLEAKPLLEQSLFETLERHGKEHHSARELQRRLARISR
jgi:eukaryotic-like serine/threonine-protein kinase